MILLETLVVLAKPNQKEFYIKIFIINLDQTQSTQQ